MAYVEEREPFSCSSSVHEKIQYLANWTWGMCGLVFTIYNERLWGVINDKNWNFSAKKFTHQEIRRGLVVNS